MSAKRPSVTRGDLSTLAIHGGREADPARGAIVAPIHLSTTFVRDEVGVPGGGSYSRVANPTVDVLERALGSLEGAPSAVSFATGMGAFATLAMALASAGDHIVCGEVSYGGTVRFLRVVLARFGVETTFVDATDASAVAAALRPRTRLVIVETPANPTMVLADTEAIGAVCRAAGVPLAVDNTFLTSVLQPVLDQGADVALYSTTKYLEGHNASMGGALVDRDAGRVERYRFLRKNLGSIQKPFDAGLVLRGLKTLPLRMERHSASAERVARYLRAHPRVRVVHYPGLETHPQHELGRRQQRASGGMLSFELDGGARAAKTMLAALRLVSLAESLGSPESLATHPVSMTHADVPAVDRERLGISDALVRLSVGLEDPADIEADLGAAIEVATGAAKTRKLAKATPRAGPRKRSSPKSTNPGRTRGQQS